MAFRYLENWQKALLACLCLICFTPQTVHSSPRIKAVEGQMDLSAWDSKDPLPLYGDWWYFSDELLTPEDLLQRLAGSNTLPTISMSQSLQDYPLKKEPGSPFGYGTYALRIKGLKPSLLGLNGMRVYLSARLFLFRANEASHTAPILELGRVATQASETQSSITTQRIVPVLVPNNDDLYVLIQVANFHHSWAGIWIPPTLGEMETLVERAFKNQGINFLICGIQLFIAFYNIMLYVYRREDKENLYLGLLSLNLFIRTSIYARYGEDFFGDGYWCVQLSLKIIYSSLICLPLWGLFVGKTLFPRQTTAPIITYFIRLAIFMSIGIMITPTTWFGFLGPIIAHYSLFLGFVCLVVVLLAVRAREPASLIMLATAIFFLGGGVVEWLFNNDFITWGENWMAIGMTFGAACQSQIISNRFALAFRRAELLSQNLQSEVLRQTRDIRSLLDNLNQGIFTIVRQGLQVGSLFSAQLKTIIGRDRIEGETLQSILLQDAKLTEDKKAQIEASIEAFLGEDILAFELNQGNLVQEVEYRHPVTGQAHALELDWIPMLEMDRTIEKLLVSVKDVTEIRNLRQAAKDHSEELEILQEIIGISEHRFLRFFDKSKIYINESLELLAQNSERSILARIFINLHTLKGVARSYHFAKLANEVHLVEDSLSAMRQDNQVWNPEQIREQLLHLQALMNRYSETADAKLGWKAARDQIQMDRSALIKLLNDLQTISPDQDESGQRSLASMERFLLNQCHSSFLHIIEEARSGLDSLARSLNKPLPTFDIRSPDVIIEENAGMVLHGCLTHLIRNSIDHGIESPERRQISGKSPTGIISLIVTFSENTLQLEFFDDGQGLDLVGMRSKAVELKLSAELLPETDLDAAQLMFVPGFSTKGIMTEISGRGVGMDAVRVLVESIGGQVTLQLLPGKAGERRPFAILLNFPLTIVMARKFAKI